MPTFHEYASWWLTAKTEGVIGDKPIDANTQADYRWRLSVHLLPCFGDYRLDEIDRRVCLRFKETKLRESEELRRAIAAGAELRGSGDCAARARGHAEITLMIGNFVDGVMAGSEDVRRHLAHDFGDRGQLVAEHGFSALVTVQSDGRRSSVLYDGGLTPDGLGRNLDVLAVAVKDLHAIVISHGHADHHRGLEGLFARYGRYRLPLVIHPDAWRERKVAFPTGAEIGLPPDLVPSRSSRRPRR